MDRVNGKNAKSGRTPYRKAFEVALQKYRQQNPFFAATHTGTDYDELNGRFFFLSMGQEVFVTYPGGDVCWAGDGQQLPLGWRLITLNYLSRGDGRPLTGHLISYREMEGGKVFFPNLKAKTIDWLAAKLSSRTAAEIKNIFARFKGTPVEGCDLGATFYLFPRFPVTVKLWLADEEFPMSANILFDAAAGGYLHTEDIAAAASIVATCLQANPNTTGHLDPDQCL
jgi:hypothetical protein